MKPSLRDRPSRLREQAAALRAVLLAYSLAGSKAARELRLVAGNADVYASVSAAATDLAGLE